MNLKMGEIELEMGGHYLGSLRDANDLLHDSEALRNRMAEDGYLWIRSLHRADNIRAARAVVLESLKANGQLDSNSSMEDGVAGIGKKGRFLGGSKQVTHTPEFLGVVDSPEIMNFFEGFLNGPVLTFDYKWLRAVGPGDSTPAHYDVVYMGRGTRNLYTVWTPLGDVPYDMGPLALLVGSHRFDEMKATYGEMDVDRDRVSGQFTHDVRELVDTYGGCWCTGEFEVGDVLIIGMFTMHGSITNTSNRYRISSDTRYQLATEPVDERWMGENPIAHYAWMQGETVPMDEMRRKWNV
jgi:hypothetical protein